MAIFFGKFLKGLVGDLIFRVVGKRQQVSRKHVKKTKKRKLGKGTVVNNGIFGMASGLACSIRDNFNQIITEFYDGGMIYTLNADVYKIIKQARDEKTKTYNFTEDSFKRLIGFEFNNASPLKDLLLASINVEQYNNIIRISLPELKIPKDLKMTLNSSYFSINIGVCLFDLENCVSKRTLVSTKQPKGVKIIPAQSWEFDTHPGCLCVTVMNIQSVIETFSGNFLQNNERNHPAAIVSAIFTSGTPILAFTRKWRQSFHQQFKRFQGNPGNLLTT
ncbi:hypothetical protein [Pedobacter metabolipauper]|uniref:Uncharacterized protein n=1 Tax=Pedobacter metabolipauper TaxID=425513 RepID=A0A4R6T2I0_9SPHI|nr:hypothetical protein [Pedobacter metabolipauper]TDQ11551.1 hypothetical protein ATK78_0674 [Pedobacter metabolipauper]